MTNNPLSPVQIARIALVRLSEKGVPPTPENYSRFYNEVAGINPEDSPEQDQTVLAALASAGVVISEAADTTEALLDALGGHSEGLRNSIDTLRQAEPADKLVELTNEILRTTVAMHQSVDASHGELRLMRDSLVEIRTELAQNRPAADADLLTGAKSRSALDGILRHCIARARRYNGPLSVAMFDLDRFHHINDHFGSAIGDKVLAHIGELTRSALRESDIFIRFGGEEFLILMPETEAPGAQYVLDRLRLILQKTPLIHNGQRLVTTFSAGVAELAEYESHRDLVERANEAMLAAKQAGRNTVMRAVTPKR